MCMHKGSYRCAVMLYFLSVCKFCTYCIWLSCRAVFVKYLKTQCVWYLHENTHKCLVLIVVLKRRIIHVRDGNPLDRSPSNNRHNLHIEAASSWLQGISQMGSIRPKCIGRFIQLLDKYPGVYTEVAPPFVLHLSCLYSWLFVQQ